MNTARRSTTTTPARGATAGTRDRLLSAMARGLRRRGLHGVGLAQLLAEAEAPKGVLYHHFPGGKNELAAASIRATSARLLVALDRLVADRRAPLPVLRAWFAASARQLEASGFELGCPLATVALETTADDVAIRAALADAFTDLRDRLVPVLVAAGVARARARRLAALILSAYEGALLQARVERSAAPMADTAQTLIGLLRPELEAARPGR